MYEAISDLLQSYKPKDTVERGVPSKKDEIFSQHNTKLRAFSRMLKQTKQKVIDVLHWLIDNLLINPSVDYKKEFSRHECIYDNTKKKLNTRLNATAHQY